MAVDMGTGSLQKRGQLGTVGLARGSRLGWRLRGHVTIVPVSSAAQSHSFARVSEAWFTAPNLLPRCHFGRGSATPGQGPLDLQGPPVAGAGSPGWLTETATSCGGVVSPFLSPFLSKRKPRPFPASPTTATVQDSTSVPPRRRHARVVCGPVLGFVDL